MNFRSPFCQLLPRISDPNLVSRLSPSGYYMASVGTNGDLLLVDVRSGHVLGSLCFDAQRRISMFKWATDTVLVLVSDSGEVIKAQLMYNTHLNKLATLSTVIPASGKIPLALCYQRERELLAVAFADQIKIWEWNKTPTPARWDLSDTIKCETRGVPWTVTDILFPRQNRTSLLIMSNTGLALWNGGKLNTADVTKHQGTLSCYAESPNGLWLASSRANLCIALWPLDMYGVSAMDQVTFKVPAGQDWVGHTLPIAFSSGSDSIFTADPVGTVYVFSLQGNMQHTFSVGVNYFVRSILVHEQMVYIVAMGPTCTTMLIRYTKSPFTFERVEVTRQASSAMEEPRMIIHMDAVPSIDYPNPNTAQLSQLGRKIATLVQWSVTTYGFVYARDSMIVGVLVLGLNEFGFDLLSAYNVGFLITQAVSSGGSSVWRLAAAIFFRVCIAAARSTFGKMVYY